MTWPVLPLGEVAQTALGKMLDKGKTKGHAHVPYLRNVNVQWGRIDTHDLLTMELADVERDRFAVQQGDLLVCEGGEIGRCAIWQGRTEYLGYQKALHRIRPKDNLDARFLRYLLEHHAQTGALASLATGSTIAHLPQQQLRRVPVPLPPLDEQRRIVDLLEDHLSRLGAACAELGRLDQRARLLVQSSLAAGLRGELVGDDLSEGVGHDLLRDAGHLTAVPNDRTWATPETWAWTRLGELFEVNIGATPSRSDASHWNGDLPWISSGEVAFGHISNTRERITRAAAGNPATRIHPPGTVMVAMIGEGKTRGQAALLDIEAAHNQNCASIRVSATEVLPEFVFGYFEERYLETRRGGAGGQQPALNKAAIRKFAIPIPPLGTQRRLVAAWAEAKGVAARLGADLDVARRRSDVLRRSLLADAFSGQLTCEGDT